MNLNGSVCIVTGSATGVGAACAVRLAAKGARGRRQLEPQRARERRRPPWLAKRPAPRRCWFRRMWPMTPPARRMADATLQRWGRIDALVNNAGITKFADPANLDLIEGADFHRLLDVNVIGAFQMTRAVGSGDAGARAGRNCERILKRDRDRRRQLNRLYGLEGRAECDDIDAGAGAGARDPGQCRQSGRDRFALDEGWPRRCRVCQSVRALFQYGRARPGGDAG